MVSRSEHDDEGGDRDARRVADRHRMHAGVRPAVSMGKKEQGWEDTAKETETEDDENRQQLRIYQWGDEGSGRWRGDKSKGEEFAIASCDVATNAAGRVAFWAGSSCRQTIAVVLAGGAAIMQYVAEHMFVFGGKGIGEVRD